MAQRKKKKSKKRVFFTLLALVAVAAIVVISVNTFLLTDFDYNTNGDELTVLKYSGTELTDVVIKDSYLINGRDYKTTTIGQDAFKGLAVEKLTLPDSVKTIEDNAFKGCEKMTEVKLPSKLEFMGQSAFSHCKSLRKIDIPGTLQTISKSAFADCKNLKYIHINEGCKIVAESAFSNTYAENVLLPRSLTEIKTSAFDNINVAELEIPNGVETIGIQAFGDNNSLLTVTLPKSVTKVGRNVFKNCQRLAVINNLAKVDLDGAYDANVNPVINYGKKDVSTIDVHNETGNFIFVQKDTGYELVGFDYVSTDVTTPTLVVNDEILPYSIGACAFYAGQMKTLVVDDHVTKISSLAFANSLLEKLTIGEGVKLIERDCLSGCTKLEQIKFVRNGTWYYKNEDGDVLSNPKMTDPYANKDIFFSVYGAGYWYKD